MDILFFSQFAPPETGAAPTRLIEHTRRWAEAGHRVTVVTNVPNSPRGVIYPGYRNGLLQTERVDGVEFQRVWTLVAGKGAPAWRRAAGAIAYVVMSTLGALRVKRPDVVIGTAPYLAGIPACLASLWHRAPFVYEMRDPWIEVARSNGLLGTTAYRLLTAMERFLARRAREVVVISGEMAEAVRRDFGLARTPAVVHNAATHGILSDAAPADPAALPTRPTAAFIGNMGHQYDIDVIIDAAARVGGDACDFVFVGEGAQRARVQEAARRRGLEHVRFAGVVPPSELGHWIRACALTIVPMKAAPLFSMYLPLKVLDSLYCGVPVLFGGRGETAALLRDSGGGESFAAGDAAQLAALLERYLERPDGPDRLRDMGRAGAEYVRSRLMREHMAAKYLDVLEAVR